MVHEKIDFDKELADAERETAESLKILTQHGFVLDTTQWLTIKRYAEKYSVSQQVVVNWINRGIIPADSTMVLAELNDIRLVKDQPYK
ncbi:hypothetical protein EXU85_31300 [Spirosoma sp. KCTC 42546]|uniref:hypothetical protein n=1 Tax=Spirosoma sp. KCTC 42546 TaxID=2520506 RepID=UPI001157F148|nr:hypothetical protein [Spirosoma sp. KCTC 42546]QDK82853.1 hypothetical protein EXU85_31300 [Spirosoma sp. KCTC 42546]